jgi:hypothetical protein
VVPFLGYAPDLDSSTPGILTNCSALIPSMKGMKGAPSPTDTALPALAAACRNALVVRKLDDTVRFIAGTATKLYEAGASSWTEVTRASGGDYGLATDGEWTFAQYADQTLAAAKSDILQVSTTSNFSNAAANAPKASIVATVNNFIFLFDVNDQAAIFDGNDRPHGWWAARSSATWTPSIANEAYTGSLSSTPGKIRAGKRFGQAIIVYKERSMYQGIYIGQSGWEFNLIPGEAGAMSQNVVVDVGTSDNAKHIFMGFEDFYQFDGSRPVSIGTPLSETVFSELNKEYSYASKALHDRVNKLVYFFYPVASSSNPDKCVVYNYKTGKWGRDDRTIEAVVEYISAGVSYDDLGTDFATYADLPEVSYDSSFWTSGFPIPAIINTSHLVQTLNAPSVSSSMTTGDHGADEFLTMVSRVQPKFLTRPTSATMTNYYRENLGDALTSDSSAVMDSKGRFDITNGGRSSNWHRFLFEFTGPVEMPGYRAEVQEDGLE